MFCEINQYIILKTGFLRLVEIFFTHHSSVRLAKILFTLTKNYPVIACNCTNPTLALITQKLEIKSIIGIKLC